MGKRTVTLLIVFLLAASTLATIGTNSLTKANPYPDEVPTNHAYIKENGEIDPPTLPIQRLDNLYILTDNIVNYTLEVKKNDNIVIDGSGFSIQCVWWGIFRLNFIQSIQCYHQESKDFQFYGGNFDKRFIQYFYCQ